MFCPNCGTKIEDSARFCFRCGSKIKQDGAGTERNMSPQGVNDPAPDPAPAPAVDANELSKTAAPQKSDDKNVIALIGFILSFFASIPGIVCSAIGLKNAAANGGVKHGFAKAGLIIGIVNAAVSVIVSIAIIVTVNALLLHYGIYRNADEVYGVLIRFAV